MAATAEAARGSHAPPRPGRGGGGVSSPSRNVLPATNSLRTSQTQTLRQSESRVVEYEFGKSPEPLLEPEPEPKSKASSEVSAGLSHAAKYRRSGAFGGCCSKPARDIIKTSKTAYISPTGRLSPPTGLHDLRKPLYGTLEKYCKGSHVSKWQPRALELRPEASVLLVRDPSTQKDIDDAPLEVMAQHLTRSTFDPCLATLNDGGEIVRYAGQPVTAATLNGTRYEGTHPLRLSNTRLWNLQGAEVEQEHIGQRNVRLNSAAVEVHARTLYVFVYLICIAPRVPQALVVTTFGGKELCVFTSDRRDLRRWKQSLRFAAAGGGRALSDDDDADSMESWPSSSSMDGSELYVDADSWPPTTEAVCG